MIGNNNQGLSEDIAARHTNFVSSVSQEAQMVWLEPVIADVQTPITNRFVTHVEDIYYINNNIQNTNIQNVSLGMSFLNDIMLKTADVYAGVYNQRLSMMEKSITTANNHRTENVDNSNTTVQSTDIHGNTVSTINKLTELQNVSAGDIIKLSKETINSLKNTDTINNNTINIHPSEFVHQENSETQQLNETIQKNEQHITALENRLHSMTVNENAATSPASVEREQSTSSPTTAEQKVETELQKGESTQSTQQIFNSKTLTNLEKNVGENTNTIDKSQRPTRHYQNSNIYNNQDITSASVVYDENGRRETPAENTGETIKEVVKQTLRTVDTTMPTVTDTQVVQGTSSEKNVITSADININKTQNTAESSVSNIDIHHIEAPLTYNLQGDTTEPSETKNELVKTVSETVENLLKSENNTQSTNRINEHTTQRLTTGNVITLKNLTALQKNATQIQNNLQNVDSRLTLVNLNTETLTENGVFNTQSYLKRETLLHNLSKTQNSKEGDVTNLTNVSHQSAQSINNVHLNSENSVNNSTSTPLTVINNILKNSRFHITNNGNSLQIANMTKTTSDSVSFSITNGAPSVHNNISTTQSETNLYNNTLQNIAQQKLSEVSIVHKQESAPAVEQPQQEEDEIVTIKKTKKIENTETTETINHTMNKKNIVVSGGEVGTVQMDKAQINKLAEKVYRQLENRLRTERNRRGMK